MAGDFIGFEPLQIGSGTTVTGSDPVVVSNNNVSLKNQTGVNPGSYTSANLTVNNKGIITAISNGASSDKIVLRGGLVQTAASAPTGLFLGTSSAYQTAQFSPCYINTTGNTKTISKLLIVARGIISGTITIYLSKYNGGSWSNIATLTVTGATPNGIAVNTTGYTIADNDMVSINWDAGQITGSLMWEMEIT